jgi:O-antigen/teichoic acid export membrane protein
MKALKIILTVLSYILQYFMPIALFGYVVPYYHGDVGAGLTGAGIVALCIAIIILYSKLKEKIKAHSEGITREIFLSIFHIAIWVILGIGINKVMEFVNLLIRYWWVAFIFIILGRVCAIVCGMFKGKEGAK